MCVGRLEYVRSLFAPETPLLARIRASLSDTNDQISVFPEEGSMLQFLVRLSGARRIVEIGTLGGYSAAWMAEPLPEGGHLWTIEKDPRRYALACENLASLRDRITLLHGDAQEVLTSLTPLAPFDMIFIDGDKLGYLRYLDWAEAHIRKGGLIVADNTFLFDSVWKDELPARVRKTARDVMRGFNRRLADPSRYTGVILPTSEGMTVAVKNF